MLPPDHSPLHAVLLPLWETQRHQSHIRNALRSSGSLAEIALLRRKLWMAALQEMEANFAASRTYYDPGRDARFEWACQFLDVLDGSRDSVDTDVHARCEWKLERYTPPISGRDRAAGEKPETLAHGS